MHQYRANNKMNVVQEVPCHSWIMQTGPLSNTHKRDQLLLRWLHI